MNSKILFNGACGIHCIGEEGQPSIDYNKIENNNGPGIKIGIANKAKVLIKTIFNDGIYSNRLLKMR